MHQALFYERAAKAAVCICGLLVERPVLFCLLVLPSQQAHEEGVMLVPRTGGDVELREYECITQSHSA